MATWSLLYCQMYKVVGGGGEGGRCGCQYTLNPEPSNCSFIPQGNFGKLANVRLLWVLDITSYVTRSGAFLKTSHVNNAKRTFHST